MKYLKPIIVIIIFILIFIFLNKLLSPKYMTNLVEGNMTYEYYDEEKNHEVIFIGDCEVYANFSPMVLYEEEGIASYVRGNSQQLIWQSYYILKETLKYETPKVVVFNVNSMRYSKPVSEAYNRLAIDKMKWSKEKIDIIKASMTKEEDFLSYVIPLLRYHSRFDKLTNEDFEYLFKNKNSMHNGFLINKNIKPVESLPTKRRLSSYEFEQNCYDYLNKITKLCKENSIKLVLIKAPSVYPYWYDEYEEQIQKYAKENNLDYYNFKENVEEIGIDYSTDTYDGGLHLNLDGATKLSKYFSKILKENYELTDYRENEEISKIYNEKLEIYKEAIK
ncbi:MAG: SGNH/GDSL hydrolase family protein [Clostridia bacterium]|nr:SGNH/GDSL hydrolase family protein [Clostridia bacterium]